MKSSFFFIFSFILMLAISVMVVFFLNEFLFFIHGYTVDTSKTANVETFEAYKNIYKSKIVIIVVSLIMSIVLLLFARYQSLHNPFLIYKIIYAFCWIFVITFFVLCCLLVFLPKGPMV
jgi:hypothetical protein